MAGFVEQPSPLAISLVGVEVLDEVGHDQGCHSRLLMERDLFHARPERDGRDGRDDAGDEQRAHSAGNRRDRCWDRHRDHEGKQHSGLTGGEVAAEDAGKGEDEGDGDHGGESPSGVERGRGPDGDEGGGSQRRDQIGERAGRQLAAKVGDDQERETAKDDEDDVLAQMQDQGSEREGKRNDDRGAGRPPQGGQAWIVRRFEDKPGAHAVCTSSISEPSRRRRWSLNRNRGQDPTVGAVMVTERL